MNTQESLKMASVLGHTAASLLAQPRIGTATVEQAVEGLIIALTKKARSLLASDEVKVTVEVGPSLEAMQRAARKHLDGLIVLGADETVTIHGNGDVTIVGDISIGADSMQITGGHASDCSTNNRGVPELLGDCDCSMAPCEHTPKVGAAPFPNTITGPVGFTSENLHRYLNHEYGEGKIDHVVRVVSTNLREAQFYIRPLNADGETAQFAVTRI